MHQSTSRGDGPAKAIAWGGGAGALLSAVALLAFGLIRAGANLVRRLICRRRWRQIAYLRSGKGRKLPRPVGRVGSSQGATHEALVKLGTASQARRSECPYECAHRVVVVPVSQVDSVTAIEVPVVGERPLRADESPGPGALLGEQFSTIVDVPSPSAHAALFAPRENMQTELVREIARCERSDVVHVGGVRPVPVDVLEQRPVVVWSDIEKRRTETVEIQRGNRCVGWREYK